MFHRYILEPYTGIKSRFSCPACGKKNVFTRYVDIEKRIILSPVVGKCNRLIKCAYHYTPKKFFEADKGIAKVVLSSTENHIKSTPLYTNMHINHIKKGISYIAKSIFEKSFSNYQSNHFFQFLKQLLGEEKSTEVARRYFIGSSRYWDGATVFWQVDNAKNVRTGKVMLYNEETGKRVKAPFPHITWVHKIIGLKEYSLRQCLFGEHLLPAEPLKPIAIVESEKTAIIASAYIPDFIWLACGSINNLTKDRCDCLKGRDVVLFPDLNGYSRWNEKVSELSVIANVTISDLLEGKASYYDRQQGYDIADYLQQCQLDQFCNPLRLYSKDMLSYGSQNKGRINSNDIIIAGFHSKTGKVYNILFDHSGEFITPEQNNKNVQRLSAYYGTQFLPGFFDDISCWVQIDPNFRNIGYMNAKPNLVYNAS